MPYFHSIETRGNQRLEAFATSTVTWMGPDGNRTCPVRDRDRVFNGESVLRHERASLCAEVASEGVAKIRNEGAGDHCPRNMRPADRPAIRLMKDLIQRERDPNLIESFDYPARASVPRQAQIGQALFECIELGKMERQQVHFMILIVRTQLHACDHAYSSSFRCRARGPNAVDGVVIREGKRCQARVLRCLYYALG